jgi:hypothetical protein
MLLDFSLIRVDPNVPIEDTVGAMAELVKSIISTSPSPYNFDH